VGRQLAALSTKIADDREAAQKLSSETARMKADGRDLQTKVPLPPLVAACMRRPAETRAFLDAPAAWRPLSLCCTKKGWLRTVRESPRRVFAGSAV